MCVCVCVCVWVVGYCCCVNLGDGQMVGQVCERAMYMWCVLCEDIGCVCVCVRERESDVYMVWFM